MKKLCFLLMLFLSFLQISAQDSIYSDNKISSEENLINQTPQNQENRNSSIENIETSDSGQDINDENFVGETIDNSDFVPQDYFIDASSLIVRKSPDKNSEKIGKLTRNEQITAIGEYGNWVQINYNGTYGYVNKDFLSTVSLNIEETSEKKDLGFKDGFKETYFGSIIILTLLLVAPEVIQRRNPDRRFKTGIRQDKVPEFTMWKKLILAAVISVPIALIGGVICWIF